MTVCAAVLVLTGCSSSFDSGGAPADSVAASAQDGGFDEGTSFDDADSAADYGEAGAAGGEYGYDGRSGDDAAAPAEAPPESAGSGAGAAVIERQIIRSAQLSIEVAVPHAGTRETTRAALADAAAETAAKVRALAATPGGYVSASDGSGAVATVTLRIPASAYASVVERIGELGRVVSSEESTSDVTDEVVDLDSRIATMRSSIARLRTLMAEADSVADVISVESELTRREADLESLQARRAQLADLVSLSTVTVTIEAVTESEVMPDEPERSAFLRGLAGGWESLTAFGSWLAAVTGALLPFTPLILVVILGAVWWVRRGRSRAGSGADQPADARLDVPPAGTEAPAAAPAAPTAPAPAAIPQEAGAEGPADRTDPSPR